MTLRLNLIVLGLLLFFLMIVGHVMLAINAMAEDVNRGIKSDPEGTVNGLPTPTCAKMKVDNLDVQQCCIFVTTPKGLAPMCYYAVGRDA